jgi:hypothetical protein
MNARKYHEDVEREFRRLKRLADGALEQTDEDAFFHLVDAESNSIALIVKHVAGNLRSRFTDFFASDGEKPDRDRDGEFLRQEGDTRQALMERWEVGWTTLFETLATIEPDDFERIVRIRGEGLSVLQALQRQLTHYAYHVGQIVQLAKHLAGPRWQTLSIARGESLAFAAAPEPYLR